MAKLPVPWAAYESTRVPSSEQRTVNMYPHSKRGWRQDPGLTEFAVVADYAAGDQFNVSVPTSSIFDTEGSLFFKDDGTKMYYVSYIGINWTIYERTLSTAWDVTTAGSASTYDTGLDFGATSGRYQNLSIAGFKDDGTQIYFVAKYINDGNSYMFAHDLSTAWDVTTGSSSASKSLGSGVVFASFRRDTGGSFYVNSDGGGSIVQWDMSTAWDITTAAATSDTLSVNTAVDFFHVTTNGGYVYTLRATGVVERYALSTAFDLPTASLNLTYSAALAELENAGIYARTGSGAQFFIYGLTEVVTSYAITGTGRGAINMGDTLYAVCTSTLYSVSSTGATTSLGTIAGSDRVVMETDGIQLTITTGTDGGTIYVYNTTDGLQTVTDEDVEDTAKSAAYLDLAFYLDQSGGKFIASANNQATSYSTDDLVEAESFADDIVRMFAHNSYLYAFGEESTEVWYTSGVGRPPVDRQQVIERGITGTHAIDSIDDRVFFVDQYRRPNVLSGIQYQPIYSPAVAEAWDTYTTDSDCIVTAYSYRQQTFVDFIFPTDDASWTYHVDSGTWQEREDTSNNRSRVIDHVNVYSKLLALDRSNAKIYEFSETTYQDDGSNITRIKDTDVITTEIFGEASIFGEDMVCNNLKLTFECTAEATVTVTLAKDGGSFGQTRTLTVPAGVSTKEMNRWGKFREGIFRISTTANAGVDIIDASGDFEVLNG